MLTLCMIDLNFEINILIIYFNLLYVLRMKTFALY